MNDHPFDDFVESFMRSRVPEHLKQYFAMRLIHHYQEIQSKRNNNIKRQTNMNKKFYLPIALLLMLASCSGNGNTNNGTSSNDSDNAKPSIYAGLDEDLVSFVDSIISEEPNCEVLSISRDSSAYYDVSCIAFADAITDEGIDFFDLVDRADGRLSALALEAYPDIVSIEPTRKPVYKVSAIDREHNVTGDVLVIHDYDGWSLLGRSKYVIPESKFKAYLDVLKKKLRL